jgi:hypothetical protein
MDVLPIKMKNFLSIFKSTLLYNNSADKQKGKSIMLNPIKEAHGDYGEELIKELFKDWKHYGPIRDFKEVKEGWHDWDHIFRKGTDFFFADTKAKARRNLGDTGIDFRHWKKYTDVHKKFKGKPGYQGFRLFFVDEHPKEQRIYYIDIQDALDYPDWVTRERGINIVFFHPKLWNPVRKLTEVEVARLQHLSTATRNYQYN